MKSALSIRESFAGRQLLLTGASGFIGKVFLAMCLDYLPEIKKLVILIRPKKGVSAWERFETMVNTSYAFQNLHERHGFGLKAFLLSKVEVVEGDITQDDLGLHPSVRKKLCDETDLVINSTGLVDFFPDLRDVLSVNIEGALKVAEFTQACDHAKLLHLSTCYVAGRQNGVIPEELAGFVNPNGQKMDAEEELVQLKNEIQKALRDSEVSQTSVLARKRWLRQTLSEKGAELSKKLGWTNTYTYSKAITEALIERRFPNLGFSVFRPAIVESAMSYPFPGWNEGFNTCGPLGYLLGSWFRYLPAKKGTPFDVIPVDLVCKGMIVASAQLLSGDHVKVYQCGTSDKNLLTIDRAAELTSQSHQKYFRRKGKNFTQRKIRPLLGVKCVGQKVYPFSSSSLLEFCELVKSGLSKVSLQSLWYKHLKQNVDRNVRKLNQVESMLSLFKPFIHDQYLIFQSNNLSKNPIIEKEFQYIPENINWEKYWLDVHMPGLRRWSFSKFEKGEVAQYKPRKEVRILPQKTVASV